MPVSDLNHISQQDGMHVVYNINVTGVLVVVVAVVKALFLDGNHVMWHIVTFQWAILNQYTYVYMYATFI